MTNLVPLPTTAPRKGSKVWVQGEKRPYTVRAASQRYAVCTKPFNVRRTVLYCILDVGEGWRAPENLVFGLGAETDEQCVAMLARLETGETQLSRRYGVEWDVVRIETPADDEEATNGE